MGSKKMTYEEYLKIQPQLIAELQAAMQKVLELMGKDALGVDWFSSNAAAYSEQATRKVVKRPKRGHVHGAQMKLNDLARHLMFSSTVELVKGKWVIGSKKINKRTHYATYHFCKKNRRGDGKVFPSAVDEFSHFPVSCFFCKKKPPKKIRMAFLMLGG